MGFLGGFMLWVYLIIFLYLCVCQLQEQFGGQHLEEKQQKCNQYEAVEQTLPLLCNYVGAKCYFSVDISPE